MLSYDDKDCDLWLGSKGTLSVESQQFGHWIRASQFSPARRQTLEVKGFRGGNNHQLNSSRVVAKPKQNLGTEVVALRPLLQEVEQEARVGQHQSSTVELVDGVQGRVAEKTEIPRFGGISNSKESIPDFEEIIKDIDNDILEDHHNQHSVVTEIIQNLARREEDTTKVGLNTDSQVLVMGDSMIGDRGGDVKGLSTGMFSSGMG